MSFLLSKLKDIFQKLLNTTFQKITSKHSQKRLKKINKKVSQIKTSPVPKYLNKQFGGQEKWK